MAEYLCEEDMNTGEYISRDEALKIFHQCCDNCTSSYNGVMCRACADASAMDILIDMPATDVQPVVYAHKTINVGRRSYCSNCGKLAIMEDFCSKCGAKVKDGDVK